jgi:DNA-binding response OmpR family regulator
MLTAKGEVRDKVAGLESGADYYLTKPFEFDELLACIGVMRRRPANYQGEQCEIQIGLTCDLALHQLIKDGEVVQLTPTEYSILECLVRRRGQPVSQHEIGKHVFDFAKENWSNTIEVHIKNLRKKLERENYENPIKTIRGTGYTVEK